MFWVYLEYAKYLADGMMRAAIVLPETDKSLPDLATTTKRLAALGYAGKAMDGGRFEQGKNHPVPYTETGAVRFTKNAGSLKLEVHVFSRVQRGRPGSGH